jgi:16S rRNA pseudouridine516 synthase
VTCRHAVDQAQLAALLAGVVLHDAPEPVAALAVVALSERVLNLTIAEGKYHQVKRMIAAAGNRVEALHRIAVGGYALPDGLAAGEWRWLEAADLAQLETRTRREP